MDRLRKAILAVLAEDIDMIGVPVYSTMELIEAFNAVPGVVPITDEDVQ